MFFQKMLLTLDFGTKLTVNIIWANIYRAFEALLVIRNYSVQIQDVINSSKNKKSIIRFQIILIVNGGGTF